jgi:nucleoside-diphosphate-sugar epimerase
MKILLTGGTGFTGERTVRECLRRGHEVTCFVRPTSDMSVLPVDSVRLVEGDLADPRSLETVLRDHDALLNLASLGFGHGAGIVSAAERAGVSRALFISTTAIFTTLPAASREIRLAAERSIGASALRWTVLRPTMIYGGRRDRNMERLVRFLTRTPVVPLPGRGDALQQPVHVADVATAAVCALETGAAERRSYNIAGADSLTFEQIVDVICGLLRRKPLKVRIPSTPVVALLQFAERLGFDLPLRSEQVLRLDEDKAFDWSGAARDFGYRPRAFAEGIAPQVAESAAGRTGGRRTP